MGISFFMRMMKEKMIITAFKEHLPLHYPRNYAA